jgi:hypothetical protein
MSLMEDLRNRWAEMDEIDRKNFWIALIGIILVIALIIQLSSALSGIGSILNTGAGYVNESFEGMRDFGGMK